MTMVGVRGTWEAQQRRGQTKMVCFSINVFYIDTTTENHTYQAWQPHRMGVFDAFLHTLSVKPSLNGVFLCSAQIYRCWACIRRFPCLVPTSLTTLTQFGFDTTVEGSFSTRRGPKRQKLPLCVKLTEHPQGCAFVLGTLPYMSRPKRAQFPCIVPSSVYESFFAFHVSLATPSIAQVVGIIYTKYTKC